MICLLREVERILSLQCERVAADCGTTNRLLLKRGAWLMRQQILTSKQSALIRCGFKFLYPEILKKDILSWQNVYLQCILFYNKQRQASGQHFLRHRS